MPHMIIEHPQVAKDELNLKVLAQTLHHHLSEQETVVKSAIKTRTVLVDHVFIGEEESNKFIHITIKLKAGRSQELRDTITKSIFDKAKSLIGNDYILSVETLELAAYCK